MVRLGARTAFDGGERGLEQRPPKVSSSHNAGAGDQGVLGG